MAALRHMPARHGSLAWLIACALLLKLLVPTGWMPVFEGGRVRLELCGGYGPPPPQPEPAMAHAGHHMSGKGAEPKPHKQHDRPAADQPCAYAALSLAALGTAIPPLLAPPLVRSTSGVIVLTVAVGRGLAAPPPPSTGPPALA